MRIIPAIDIIGGRCVRLTKGDYSTKIVYNDDPLEVAKQFEAHGIEYLHMVDLDGAKGDGIVNHKVLEAVATKTSLKIDFGGGIKRDLDLEIAFQSGAAQLTVGSIALRSPETFLKWFAEYGRSRIILGADVKDEKIAISGWEEESEQELMPFLQKYKDKGVLYTICTDISKDGMLSGPSFNLYKKILKQVPEIKLIASGGISKFSELPLLSELGCEGAIIGKAIYENKISLKQLEQYIINAN